MNILAIELSAHQGSLALSGPDNFSLQEVWEQGRRCGDQIFSAFSSMLSQAGWNWSDIDCFAAGRGPGRYSGLRTALICAHSLALPDKKEVYCLSSGEVLAWGMARSMDIQQVAVVGDARRDRLWMGLFDFSKDAGDGEQKWELIELAKLRDSLPEGILIVTSDWDRLESAVKEQKLDDLNWIEGARYPRARDLAALVRLRKEQGITSEKALPIYMHPAVATPPRFPKT